MNVSTLASDTRGEGVCVEIGGKEYLVFTLNKGKYRGGEIHCVTQHTVCLRGKIQVTLKEETEKTLELTEGCILLINAGTPHLFYGEENSVFLEWKDGAPNTQYYAPYRSIVEGQQ